ncbi:hypothetical protein BGZ65_003465 [Modicella reniformis]|uniref:RING-type E3 ubiquitin transferase n=1 Tax=Modicella reniformis TaxID=1440133 RepID=A0A9P6ILM5_9FUNG|nr:hypothetical protein BGZ65_003465 [Modicella reniformis]
MNVNNNVTNLTLVYAPEMPAVIPMRVLFSRAFDKLVKVTRFILRGIFVAFIWLVMLPYFTIWIWRLYFWIGETFAYKANGLETPIWNSTSFFESRYNLTLTSTTTSTPTSTSTSTSIPAPVQAPASAPAQGADTALDGVSLLLFLVVSPEHQWISKFIMDCFEGQIISSVVVVVFVALFLLREWVLQNQQGDRARAAVDDAVVPPVGAEMDDPEFIVEHAVERLIAVQHHMEAVVEGEADLGNDSDSDDEDDNEDNGEDQENIPGDQAPAQEPIPPRPGIVPHAAPVAPIADLQPPLVPLAAEQNDDLDEFNMEELDGILEVIGMHGSFLKLLQNSLLMSALICASLGAGVWIPFTIGKTILLMSPLNVLRFPLAALGHLTDPILDYFFDHILPHTGATIPKAITDSQPLEVLYQDHILPAWNAIIEISASGAVQDVYSKDAVDTLVPGDQVSNATITANTTDPTMVHHVVQKWTEVAYGTSSGDKFAAIMLGYTILFTLALWCFARTRHAYGHTFARVARDVLRQQGLVLKIALFVTYEMIVFPLFCGAVIGLSILPMFKGSSIGLWIAFFKFSPNWSLILHWIVGTTFTYGFALFVRLCRKMVRPGAMWFLRDPNDEGVHPAREILERPALQHLRTLGQATVLYFTLIILGITFTTHSLNFLMKGVLPLRWPIDEPISDVPIDMLLCHLVLPLTARWLNPAARFKALFAAWLRALARWLRLSSFMYSSNGQRFYEEEGHFVYRSWQAWLLRWRPPMPGSDNTQNDAVGSGEELDIDAPVIFVPDGGLLRVPNTDLIFHLKDRRMLVPVDENGNALDPREDLPGEIDTLEAFRTRGRVGLVDPKENTVVIYAPPYFRYRLATFVVLLWISVMMFFVLSFVTPMVVGRAIFRLKTERHLNDIYSILVGVYSLRGLWYILDWIASKLQAIFSHGIRPINITNQFRGSSHFVKLGAKLIYFGLVFCVAMPFLLGFMVELYVILPLRNAMNDDFGVIFMVNWAVGLLYMKIIHRILSVVPNNRFAVDMNQVFNGTNVNNWDAMLATRRLILPFFMISVAMTCGPFIPAWIAAEALVKSFTALPSSEMAAENPEEPSLLEEVEENSTTIRRTRMYQKQRSMSVEPETENAHPLLRSNSRRVKDPPLWSDENAEADAIAYRTRLGRIRRLKAHDQGIE